MSLSLLQAQEELAAYDRAVRAHPAGMLWQSLAWKQYQEAIGREVRVYGQRTSDSGQRTEDSGQRTADNGMTALVTIDRTAMGISTWDIPRGPLVRSPSDDVESFLKELLEEAKKTGCMSLYFSPPQPIVHSQLSIVNSPRHEQPEATRILDLTVSEEEILAQMKPKGRYNIGVAEKSGVTVEQSEDVESFFSILQGTAERDQFSRKPQLHYEAFIKHLPGSFLLLARDANGKAISGLLGVLWNNQGIYYYGASDYASRALMAPYALQWAAIRYAKARGCASYDLLGVAPPEADPDHPWAGISAFKAKFGGTVRLYPPEQEIRLRKGARALLKMKRKMFG